MRNTLLIGLNGWIGSGKDTVAKMLYCILNNPNLNKKEAKELFDNKYAIDVQPYATYSTNNSIVPVYSCCIAFADKLKQICSLIYGIPLSTLYFNKHNAWVCINKDFEYTETRPVDDVIITAEEYYNKYNTYVSNSTKYYMSLRELIIYTGTYVLQYNINNNIFVNSLNSEINNIRKNTPTLDTVICTDVRFIHEYNYIKENKGIMIKIIRDDIKQIDNIAEHSLDDLENENFDFVIKNNGSYEDLFNNIWDLVTNNIVFQNVTLLLQTIIPTSSNFLRILNLEKCNDNYTGTAELCCDDINLLQHSISEDNQISFIYPNGGPEIFSKNNLSVIKQHKLTDIYIKDIKYDEIKNKYILYFNI